MLLAKDSLRARNNIRIRAATTRWTVALIASDSTRLSDSKVGCKHRDPFNSDVTAERREGPEMGGSHALDQVHLRRVRCDSLSPVGC